jgi:hypothetical protein
MHVSFTTVIALVALTLKVSGLPFYLFGTTTSDKLNTEVNVVRDTVPSISVLNYRIPEQRNYGLFDWLSPAINPPVQVGQ